QDERMGRYADNQGCLSSICAGGLSFDFGGPTLRMSGWGGVRVIRGAYLGGHSTLTDLLGN
ncbi:MAG: hypothetical protein ACLFVQ_06945, partial [Chitinispirillaceae bacterium]